MGAGISSEQFTAHLNRQQDLIKRLDASIRKSAERLQSAGSLAIDYTIDGDGEPQEQNDDARGLIASLYKKARDVNSLPNAEPPITEEELAQAHEQPRHIAAYNEDALIYKPWLSALFEPNGHAEVDGTAPSSANSAKLTRAIGFSGSMLRAASFVDNNTVVYAAGGVAVVQDLRSGKQRFFTEHSSVISTVAVHAGRRIVATAELGFVPVIHIWNVDTLQLVTTIADQFRTGITAMQFSPDGSRVAAVDFSDDHLLGVYSCETGLLAASAQNYADIFDVAFVGSEHVSNKDSTERNDPRLVTVGDRVITFWSTGEEDEKLIGSPALLGNAGKKQAFTACCVSGQNVVVGTQAGEIYIFQRQRLLRVLDVQTRMITCLASSPSTPTVVTCVGFDGVVSSWNIATFKKTFTHNSFYDNSTTAPIYSLGVSQNGQNILVGDTNNMLAVIDTNNSNSKHGLNLLQGGNGAHIGDKIGTFAVHPFNKRFVTGGADYQVVEWDIDAFLSENSNNSSNNNDTASVKNKAILRTHRIPAHATCCTYSPDGTLLAVGLSNGTICIFCGDELTHSFSLGKRRVQCCRFSSNGRTLAAGTADNVVEVFDAAHGFSHIVQLGGVAGVVINIDFAVNDNVIRACTQSYELVFFDIQKKSRIQLSAVDELKSLLWSTNSCLFGWSVQGIWRLDSEFNDVNAVAASHNKKLLATAETSGIVKLFRFPCVGGGLDENGVLQRRPDSRRLRGHVLNVLGVEWFGGDEYLASASSECVFVWKI